MIRMVGLLWMTGCQGVGFEGTWQLTETVETVEGEPAEAPVAYPFDLDGVQVRKEMRVEPASMELVDQRGGDETVEGPYPWSAVDGQVEIVGAADELTCTVLEDVASCSAVFESAGLPDFVIDQTWARVQ